MNVICLEDEAFYSLVEEVVQRLKMDQKQVGDKWISAEEAMRKLRISSKTTLQKLRDEGKIRFSQPEKKMILYDIDSIYAYLEKHAKRHFLIMSAEQQYIRGFNHGYLLTKHLPELVSKLVTGICDTTSEYISGFFSGKEEYELEHSRSQLDQLKELREKGKDNERDLESER